MRRSLPVASVVALVATLLTATPAAAEDLGRLQAPIVRVPTEVDPAEAVVAPVSDDAHPVTPDVELITFGADPAEGTPEAEAIAEDEAAEAESSEPTTEAEPTEVEPTEAETTEPTEEPQSVSTLATATSGAMSLSVTDEPTDGATSEDEVTEPPSSEAPSDEAPSDEPKPEAPSEDATDVPPATEDGHDHGDEGHDHDTSGEELTTQLYASSETPELSVLGVTWDLGTAPADLVVEVRTRTEEEWTAWEPMHVEATETRDDEAEIAEARDGTLPMALIDVEAVEVRLASDSALPAAPSLAVVDPGESTADAAQVTATTAMTTAATSRPTIYSRAQWGADERMMTWNPSQGRVQGIDIHHTVNANDYTAAQVPALMRSIYAYHAQDWGRGWGDIGYNFIVDRFGRIWEGRAGGVDQAPTGAHATGLNSNFSGISLLGNFDTVAVPAAAFTAVAQLAAWKLAMHGITTSGGTVTVEAGTFSRINGHRDSKQTTCPGRYMYNRLPEMRTRINSYIGSFSDRQLDRDLDGDRYPDLAVAAYGQVSLMSTVDAGSVTATTVGTGWTSYRTTHAGDFDGNGTPDIVRMTTDGRLWLHSPDASGRYKLDSRRLIGSGWGSYHLLVGGYDWDGDNRTDIVARRPDGSMWVYRGNGRGGFSGWTKIGTGFQNLIGLTMAPDFVNGRTALLGQDRSTGIVWAYPASSGGIGSRVQVTGPSTLRHVTGVGDANGDGHGDMAGIDANWQLWLYPGNGRGGVNAKERVEIGTRWSHVAFMYSMKPVGNENVRLVAISGPGALTRYGYDQTVDAYATLKPTGIALAAGDRVVVPGDWNRDGINDLMVISRAGALRLHPGLGWGQFGAGRQLGSGWSTMTVVGAGNWRGDRAPGLLAQDRSGNVWLYTASASGVWQPRVLVSSGGAQGMDRIVNAGAWNGVGAIDMLARGADTGRLFRYEGNGPGLMFPPVIAGTGWQSFHSIVGVSDANLDGKPDLVVHHSTTGALILYPGTGAGANYAPIRLGTLVVGAVIS